MAEQNNPRATPTAKKATTKRAAKKVTIRKTPARKVSAKKAPARKRVQGSTMNTKVESTDQGTRGANSLVDESLRDSSKIPAQARETAGRALRTAKDLAGAAAEVGTQAYQKSVQEAEKAARKVKGTTSQVIEKGRRFIREHPVEAASLGVAGLGVVAAIMGRKKVVTTTSSLASKAGKAVSTAGESLKKAGEKIQKP